MAGSERPGALHHRGAGRQLHRCDADAGWPSAGRWPGHGRPVIPGQLGPAATGCTATEHATSCCPAAEHATARRLRPSGPAAAIRPAGLQRTADGFRRRYSVLGPDFLKCKALCKAKCPKTPIFRGFFISKHVKIAHSESSEYTLGIGV